jgi:protein-disulfide isomerase
VNPLTTKTRSSLLISALIVVSLLVGYSFGNFYPLSGSQAGAVQNQGVQQTTSVVASWNIPSFVPYLGSNSSKINLVEFGDYQCPFCERFFQLTLPSIVQNYVNASKVRFYFMDFAILGPDSQTLAQGAWCAQDQGLYYSYYNFIYSHQGQENTGWAAPPMLKALLGNMPGLDIQQFTSCLDSQTYSSRVQQLTKLGQSLGVTGTPTVLIGNNQVGYVLVVGAQPYSVFQQVIDTQLGKAR